jgi:carbonic anhydrase
MVKSDYSCPYANAPINIINNEKSRSLTCSMKCNYVPNYANSPTSVKNNGNYLSFSYDNSTCKYNAKTFSVREIRLYHPSLHEYDGERANAELIIVHSYASEFLLVCVPIIIGGATSSASLAFSKIMPKIKSLKINDPPTSIPTINFNLTNFVPNVPFYSYKGTAPYAPECNTEKQNYNYVVFTKSNGGFLNMNSKDFTTLTKTMSVTSYPSNDAPGAVVKSGTEYFYNKNGPASSLTFNNDDIYIDCSPTSESKEEVLTDVPIDSDADSLAKVDPMSEFLNSKYTIFFLKMFVISLIIVFFMYVLQIIGGSKKMPDMATLQENARDLLKKKLSPNVG